MCSRIEKRQREAGEDLAVSHILAGNSESLAWGATCGRHLYIPLLLLRFVDPQVAAEPCGRCTVCLTPGEHIELGGLAVVVKQLIRRTSHIKDKRKACILTLAKFLSAASCDFAKRNHLEDYPERSIFRRYDIQLILQMITLLIANGSLKARIDIDPQSFAALDLIFME
ncbi:unnamed protein product [Bemisia tabaci]|uniref:Uncharacterized protein n=1 Tax=Bemisia tabaci TaxID=7038 RepID=A0AAI8UU53_BEMTA|nr:unnamed protein product [Bemisia tabaci]